MAGAGGIVATNHLFNVAAKDGTVDRRVQNNTPFEPLFGDHGGDYDPLKFNWLGTPVDRNGAADRLAPDAGLDLEGRADKEYTWARRA